MIGFDYSGRGDGLIVVRTDVEEGVFFVVDVEVIVFNSLLIEEFTTLFDVEGLLYLVLGLFA